MKQDPVDLEQAGFSYLGDPRLELIGLLAIGLHDLGAGTEHGLSLCRNKKT